MRNGILWFSLDCVFGNQEVAKIGIILTYISVICNKDVRYFAYEQHGLLDRPPLTEKEEKAKMLIATD